MLDSFGAILPPHLPEPHLPAPQLIDAVATLALPAASALPKISFANVFFAIKEPFWGKLWRDYSERRLIKDEPTSVLVKGKLA